MFINSKFFSERTIELILSLDSCSGIAWCEVSGRKLPPLMPHSFQTLEFKAVPLSPGLKSISGIRLLDTFLKRSYPFDDLFQVFVVVDENVCKSKSV